MAGGQKEFLTALRHLYENNDWARTIFDRLAALRNNPQATPIANWVNLLGQTPSDIIGYARQLQDVGCGTYIVGRRGGKSRFQWSYNAISLGRAASGATDDLVEVDEKVDDAGEEEVSAPEAEAPLTLTIPQAKEALARTLGVRPEQIEIIVKA